MRLPGVSVEAAPAFKLGAGGWAPGWCSREVGDDGVGDKCESEVDVGVGGHSDLEPVGGGRPERDPGVLLELGPAPPDLLPGEPDVDCAIGIYVRDLAPADPHRGTFCERSFTDGRAFDGTAALDHL